ncbi:ATP-binding cassette domain-containing protein [Oceanospirillum sp. D5]|uniref:ATP-binding cassette domain-containing protein n=2 Tax=Oceanospirillum sediminis TaxID=2760088 RepID=A0A839IP31_9GAMM|nr:ATP-binding cassette domain-containing protein [Oceanospirillum sediminis]
MSEGLLINRLIVNYGVSDLHYQLNVEPGECLAIQGESGVGKTTLLYVIAGFQAACQGEVLWQGRDILMLQADQRPVSMLFQEYNLFEHLTVWQNLILGFHDSVPEQALRQAAEQLLVAEQLNKLPGELSGGQRQRIGLIRTLLRPEPLILLDEPFAELDAKTRQLAAQWVREVALKENKTLLLVTHHQEDVEIVADRKWVLTGESF